MTNMVGAKGQVVIEKAIRESLGLEAGYVAVQKLVGDHVEIRFYPPEHNRSLRGRLAKPSERALSSTELADAREQAWSATVQADWEGRVA